MRALGPLLQWNLRRRTVLRSERRLVPDKQRMLRGVVLGRDLPGVVRATRTVMHARECVLQRKLRKRRLSARVLAQRSELFVPWPVLQR